MQLCSFGASDRLNTSSPMSEDIAHYKRAKYEPGNPDNSIAWLWAASCRYLLMKREEYMQQSLNLSLIHISEPTRQAEISKAAFGLKKKKK